MVLEPLKSKGGVSYRKNRISGFDSRETPYRAALSGVEVSGAMPRAERCIALHCAALSGVEVSEAEVSGVEVSGAEVSDVEMPRGGVPSGALCCAALSGVEVSVVEMPRDRALCVRLCARLT